MGRVNRQNIAFVFSRGKTHPGMRCSLRRMAAAVHPDSSRLLVVVDVLLDGDEFLRDWIALFPNPEIVRSTIDVRDNVHFALMLRYREAGGVPRQTIHACSVRNRQTHIIREFRARPTLMSIFMKHG